MLPISSYFPQGKHSFLYHSFSKVMTVVFIYVRIKNIIELNERKFALIKDIFVLNINNVSIPRVFILFALVAYFYFFITQIHGYTIW